MGIDSSESSEESDSFTSYTTSYMACGVGVNIDYGKSLLPTGTGVLCFLRIPTAAAASSLDFVASFFIFVFIFSFNFSAALSSAHGNL